VKQILEGNTGSARPISATIQLVATIRSPKADRVVRMRAEPVRFVEVRKVK
jgi:hypothetical protein